VSKHSQKRPTTQSTISYAYNRSCWRPNPGQFLNPQGKKLSGGEQSWRIAANIAKLPELLRKPQQPAQ
jgi:hypothetical protein